MTHYMLEIDNPRNNALVPKILAGVKDFMCFTCVGLWLLYSMGAVL
ncbi:MAG: hypothetical protein OEN50_18250 [Deltaproteobacteria bacterium]|nr:hypothetical protein [Deltaproteobacteria bacterium]